jgi:ABC-type branched-subunit amino acid transport system substrate-binding protein
MLLYSPALRRFERWHAVVAIVSAFVLSMTAPLSAAGAPFEFNLILPETGPAAFIGQSYVRALPELETVINQTGGINGRPVRFVVSDTASNGQVGLQLVNALIAKHVSFLSMAAAVMYATRISASQLLQAPSRTASHPSSNRRLVAIASR